MPANRSRHATRLWQRTSSIGGPGSSMQRAVAEEARAGRAHIASLLLGHYCPTCPHHSVCPVRRVVP
eukprot:366506-Chlamydomonas_euryale.AAC.3